MKDIFEEIKEYVEEYSRFIGRKIQRYIYVPDNTLKTIRAYLEERGEDQKDVLPISLNEVEERMNRIYEMLEEITKERKESSYVLVARRNEELEISVVPLVFHIDSRTGDVINKENGEVIGKLTEEDLRDPSLPDIISRIYSLR